MKTDLTTPELVTPMHPILTGVKPYLINEEFYYNIHFKDHDSRLTPLLKTANKNEPESHVVAWAVQRANGGRSVATTMGHYHSNLALDGFRTMLLNGIVWSTGLDILVVGLRAPRILPSV